MIVDYVHVRRRDGEYSIVHTTDELLPADEAFEVRLFADGSASCRNMWHGTIAQAIAAGVAHWKSP